MRPGVDLSNDTKVRVIGSMEPRTVCICMEILGNLSEKFRAKFPALHVVTPQQNLPVLMVLSQKSLNRKQAQ